MQPAVHFPPSRQSAINSEPDVWQNRLTNLLAAAASPFIGMGEIPNPVLAPVAVQSFTHSTNLNLIGQDKFFGAAGQGPNYDWQNPALVKKTVPSFDPVNLLTTTLSVTANPFIGSVWDVPLRSKVVPALDPINLLQSTLAAVVGSPFYQTEWPNPAGREFAQNLRTFIDQSRVTQGQDTFFGGPGQPPSYVQQPNPICVRHVPSFDPFNFLTNLSVTANPIIGESVEVPMRVKTVPAFDPVNLISTTLSVTANPFVGMSDVVPVSSPHRELGFEHAVNLNLISQDQFFGAPGQVPANTDWPVPLGPEYPVALRTFIDSLRLSEFVVHAKPFLQTEWPVPSGRPTPIDNLTWALSSTVTVSIVSAAGTRTVCLYFPPKNSLVLDPQPTRQIPEC